MRGCRGWSFVDHENFPFHILGSPKTVVAVAKFGNLLGEVEDYEELLLVCVVKQPALLPDGPHKYVAAREARMSQPVGNGPAVRDLPVGRGRAARVINRGVRGDFLSGAPVQLDVRADVIVPQVDVRAGVANLGPVEADTVDVVSLVHDVVLEVDLHGTASYHPCPGLSPGTGMST